MKLNLGCQVHYFDGWTNQDIVGDDPNMKVDLVCPAEKLPLEDNSVDFIYAGHLIEHYYPDTLKAALLEWHRVLKPRGKLVIVTPDCGAIMKDYAIGTLPDIEAAWQPFYGRIYSVDGAPERHHIAFDRNKLLQLTNATEGSRTHSPLVWYGWDPMNFDNPPDELKPFMGKHITRGWPPHNNGYQLGIILTK